MADSKKYYYMRLTENFFESNEMIALESLPDGCLYSNILLKMYVRSLRGNGRLVLNDRIPYSAELLASVTRHSVGVVEKALDVFVQLGLVEVLDSGAIYMLDIQNFIGQSSTEADRKRAYRAQIEKEKKSSNTNALSVTEDKCPDKPPPEIEIEIEIEKEGASKPPSRPFTPPTMEEVSAYCQERKNDVNPQKFFDYFQESGWVDAKGNKVRNWKQKVITWEGRNSHAGAEVQAPSKPKTYKTVVIDGEEVDIEVTDDG